MTTSGSSDFSLTRNQVIARAGRLIGAIKAGETMGSGEITDFAEALNAMVKAWQAKSNMKVWTVTEATLFPQVEQSQYALSLSSTDHATQSYAATDLTADAVSGATSISVSAIAGMASGDHIGVVVNDGSLYWTTVNGAPSGTTVTLTAGLSEAANAGAAVFTYTTKIVRPLKIVDVRRSNISSAIETPLSPPLARLDYQHLPNKSQTGTINQCFYDPQLATGYLYLWQPPSAVTDLVKFTWHRPLMDFDAAGDTPDMPQEWYQALAYNLAVVMAPEYDIPGDKLGMLAQMAMTFLDDVAGFDREAESIAFGVDMNG